MQKTGVTPCIPRKYFILILIVITIIPLKKPSFSFRMTQQGEERTDMILVNFTIHGVNLTIHGAKSTGRLLRAFF